MKIQLNHVPNGKGLQQYPNDFNSNSSCRSMIPTCSGHSRKTDEYLEVFGCQWRFRSRRSCCANISSQTWRPSSQAVPTWPILHEVVYPPAPTFDVEAGLAWDTRECRPEMPSRKPAMIRPSPMIHISFPCTTRCHFAHSQTRPGNARIGEHWQPSTLALHQLHALHGL